jgi:hypothetical protein
MQTFPPFKQWSSLPGVSILCPTYGRAARLPGLIQSYLEQDYQGPLELIILNDRHDQSFQLPPVAKPVSIINITEQFPTLGDKRNRLVALAQYPYVAWWDDDDRYLPTRISRGMGTIRQRYRGSLEGWIWLNDGKALTLQRPWSPFANAIIEKQAIIDAGGFPSLQMHQDVALMQVLVHKLNTFHAEPDLVFPTTIYRKPGTSNHTHVGQYSDPSNNAAARAYMQGSVDVRIADGLEPSGTITLLPKWGVDYVALAQAAWDAIRPTSPPVTTHA